ncbi:xanthine dehydrogenase family protein molybdopterin-binding subunit [Oceanicoccus sp. KOV_DT_Chl]|uniref:xanthine dehydrogenase family protein molybdopterin-binding subunit n=1 Tax=Oceanicoccus sp. KOV_DT_Chl TaxID=1904639 RepID=UPI000C7DDAEF|nr:molybdopterin cofactor-binding domain-containing protein [Oceanicoccus sp. KOV_DT_Chl]
MISRRSFLIAGLATGGGLALGITYASHQLDDGSATEKFANTGKQAVTFNAWLKISPDGEVTIGIHRAEMGQGIINTLAILLAEELDADWQSITFEFTPVDRDYFNFGMMKGGQPFGDPDASVAKGAGTWLVREVFHAMGLSITIGSSSTVDAWDTLRPAGASARQMLISAAAKRWHVPKEQLDTRKGYVINPSTGEQLSYGELAEAAAKEKPPGNPILKSPADFRLIGTNPPRIDEPLKVTGKATYGLDIQLPDMLYGAVMHGPIAGSEIESFSAEALTDRNGIQAIFPVGKPGIEMAVAVVADNSWIALEAAKRIKVISKPPVDGTVNSDTLYQEYREKLNDPDLVIFRQDGDVNAALKNAQSASQSVVTASYDVPYLAHVCMEPMNATALFENDSLTIWAPTQAHSMARDVGAEITGIDPSKVMVHTTFLGGGFGRRSELDFVEQAVSAAMRFPGRPVKLMWSREQDVLHDMYRPAGLCKIQGAIDSSGKLTAIDFSLVMQSVVASLYKRTPNPRGGDARKDSSMVSTVNPSMYAIENLKVSYIPVDSHIPAGAWRSVSKSWNVFFMESFIDELAAAANHSPLAVRLKSLNNQPRHLAVLKAVETRVKGLTNIGFAVTESHGSVVAHAIEVEVNENHTLIVKRVVCAVDCGQVIHPNNVIAQVESSIIDGLSSALFEQVTFVDGVAQQDNFNNYKRMRMNETPTIETILLDSPKQRPGGMGEPAVPGVAPALTNAIFQATGMRIRSLPIMQNSEFKHYQTSFAQAPLAAGAPVLS